MLSPRLSNCPECADIPSLLKKIDCKLAELGNNLYNNVSYILNKPVPAGDILQLIGYRRILQYKYVNPNYAHRYSVQMIASRVIRLTAGCVSKCNTPEPCLEESCDVDVVLNPTTTSTSTLTTCKSYLLYNTANSAESFLIGNCNTGEPETITLQGLSSVCIETIVALNVSSNIVVIEKDSCTTTSTSTTLVPTTTTTSSSSTSTSTSTSSSTSTTSSTTTIQEFICFCIFGEGVGCEYTEELPLLGNAPFQNGRPVYDIGGGLPGTLYYDGSQWIYASQDLAPVLQPLLNSSFYPIGTYSEWGDATITGLMYSSTLGTCPTTTTTTTTVYCENYIIQGTATFSSWIGLSCNGTPIGGGLGSGSTATTGCMQADSLQLFGAQIKQDLGPCPTTTTTTTTI